MRGQNGWLSNSCGNSDYNANVVNTSSYPSAQWPGTPPTKALQIDNSVTQGCFSGLANPAVPKAAGYPNALADESVNPATQCGPTCNPFFSVEFVVTSATGAWQPALEMSISPVFNNQGARMQYIGLWHTTDSGSNQKLLVFTNDVEGVFPANTPTPCFQCANFVPWEIKYVDPALPHKIGMTMQFVQPNPDVVKFYVDGVLSGVSQRASARGKTTTCSTPRAIPAGSTGLARGQRPAVPSGQRRHVPELRGYQGNCDSARPVRATTSTANNGSCSPTSPRARERPRAAPDAVQRPACGAASESTSTGFGRRLGTVHSAAQLR